MNKDATFGVVIVLASGLLLWFSSGITSVSKWDVLGPAAYPRAILWTILALSAGLILKSLRKKDTPRTNEPAARPAGLRIGFVPVVFALLFVYVLLVSRLGFTISSAAFLFAVQCFLLPPGKRPWVTLAVTSLALPAAIAVIFDKALGIYLPGFVGW